MFAFRNTLSPHRSRTDAAPHAMQSAEIMTAPRPTSPEARALAELLDVIEPALTLTPPPVAKPAPAKAPAPKPQPERQQALDLN